MYHTTPSNGTYAGESANEPLSSEARETRALLARVLVIEEGWTDTLYHDLEEESTLTNYLSSSSSGYGVDSNGKGRWTALPHTPVGARQLSARLTEIISSIIAHLSVHGEDGATRQAVNTHSPPLTGMYGTLESNYPDISIKATGPSFEKPRPAEAYLGWSNVASAFSVRPDGLPLTGAKQVSSIVDQCQEIFAHQPNRNFIRSLILTQSTARLVHCDHTGTYLTPPINIHDRPHTFIRLILGLSSANESILGFDVSIQWTIHPVSGNKGVGTIEALDEENVMTSYTLGANEPPFIQAILGRGTTCWCATHPVNGERVVIKDSWRPDSRRSEGEFLDAARGIDGVVQVISYQDRCAETKDYRPSFTGETSFENRVKSRAVLKRYGECIDHFTSRFQAIAAFRDVIVGKRGIFHKDISIQNILFGAPGAAPGSRGILIDLGMANWLSSPIEELRVNAFMGTRRFQSIAVLLSANTSCYPPYDHLDDLESLFYVLCDLVLLFEKPGGKILDSVNLNEVWDNPLPAAGAIAKSLSIFHSVFIKASDFWGGLCERLVVGFKDILRPAVEKKFMIRKPPPRRLVVGGEEKYERLVEVGREWSCVEMLVWESDQAFRRYTSCD